MFASDFDRDRVDCLGIFETKLRWSVRRLALSWYLGGQKLRHEEVPLSSTRRYVRGRPTPSKFV